MLTFPNAKINLGLNITEKRPDGYHNLETIFYPVPIEDALELNILNEGKGKFRLHQAGLEIEGEAENNLVVKAYKLLDDRFNLPPVDIHLFKHIPSGAGLGGGSADAAFMLKLLNNKFELGLPDDTMPPSWVPIVPSSSKTVRLTQKVSEISFLPFPSH